MAVADKDPIGSAITSLGDAEKIDCIVHREDASVGSKDHDKISLSAEHRDYLQHRHGTTDLSPIPYSTDADPYNWPQRKKMLNLLLIAFHAMMGTFNAAAIIPAYAQIAAEFNVSVPKASYLTSLQIAILGGAPLFWRPLCNRFGRRPVFLFSLFATCICNIGCAESYSFASLATARALVAFFVSPAGAIGSAVVTESFFKKERARYIGVWTVMVTIGVPVAPFVFGFVAFRVGFRWIFWILAIVHGVELVLYAFFGPETRYLGPQHQTGISDVRSQYLSIRRIDPTPLTFREFIHPLTYFAKPGVAIAAGAYSMVFLFGSILITVEIPQLFGEKFEFNAQQLGLQFIAVIIGSLIGEQIGGFLSDWWMNRCIIVGSSDGGDGDSDNSNDAEAMTRIKPSRPDPEFRLWLGYPGILLTITGLVVFLVQTERAAPLRWNITPLIGAAIASVGNQIVTTVFITYAVDCYAHDAASIGVFITFVRQIWGFIGPFWFPYMFDNVGLGGSAGIGAACIVVASLIPAALMHAFGRRWRT